MKRVSIIIVTLLVSWALIGCSVTAKVWKPYDKITVTADQQVNPDSNQRVSPVQIKIYELSSRATFDNLDFDRAFYQADTLLSDQLLSQAQYAMQPGETIEHTVDLKEQAKFIAIVAGFIDIDNARWKHIYPVKSHGHYKHNITIKDTAIIPGEVEQAEEDTNDDSSASAPDESTIDKGIDSLKKANDAKQAINGLIN